MTDLPWPKPNVHPEMIRREWIDAHEAVEYARAYIAMRENTPTSQSVCDRLEMLAAQISVDLKRGTK